MRTKIRLLTFSGFLLFLAACQSPAQKNRDWAQKKIEIILSIGRDFNQRAHPTAEVKQPSSLMSFSKEEGRNAGTIYGDNFTDSTQRLKAVFERFNGEAGTIPFLISSTDWFTFPAGLLKKEDPDLNKKFQEDMFNELKRIQYLLILRRKHFSGGGIDHKSKSFAAGRFAADLFLYEIENQSLLASFPIQSMNDSQVTTSSKGDANLTLKRNLAVNTRLEISKKLEALFPGKVKFPHPQDEW